MRIACDERRPQEGALGAMLMEEPCRALQARLALIATAPPPTLLRLAGTLSALVVYLPWLLAEARILPAAYAAHLALALYAYYLAAALASIQAYAPYTLHPPAWEPVAALIPPLYSATIYRVVKSSLKVLGEQRVPKLDPVFSAVTLGIHNILYSAAASRLYTLAQEKLLAELHHRLRKEMCTQEPTDI